MGVLSSRLPARLRLPFASALLLLASFTVIRVFLLALYHPPAPVAFGDYIKLFLAGLHQDIVVSLAIVTPVAIWCLLRKHEWTWNRPGKWLLAGLLVTGWLIEVFLFLSEYFFFDEFQSRFNTVAIDYLIYPHEVFTNMYESYPLPAILAGVAALGAGFAWLTWKLGPPSTGGQVLPFTVRAKHAGFWCAGIGALCMTVWQGETHFSNERVINEIAANGMVSGARAAITRNLEYAAFYPTLPKDEAYQRVRKLLSTPDATFVSPDPTNLHRRIAGDPAKPKLNVCLLLEESLGSEFWGSLGRKDKQGNPHSLTRRLDEVAEQYGMLFTNLYADGNRTIRGFEAVFSSFPPLPGDSIVARDRTENVETIARVLRRDGYDTTFIYAGDTFFDGMGPFAINNGWDRFIDQSDFPNPTFTTAWGVCNEDLYNRAVEEMRELHKKGKPFLVTTLSVSNHRPFTYPPGRIKEDPNKKKRDYAVKYTDYALGQFFKKVRAEEYWKDTIFVVIADHGARVYGSQDIPIKSYEIPLLVVGPAVVKQPSRVDILGCQLDVAPTLLGMIGRPYESLFFGHDLFKAPVGMRRVFMHHNREVAIYKDERLVVFGLNKTIQAYSGDPKKGEMKPLAEPDDVCQTLTKDAASVFQVADELYMKRQFKLDADSGPSAELARHQK